MAQAMGSAETHDGNQSTRPRRSEESLRELVSDLTTEAQNLVQQEIRLAKAELTQEASRAGKAGGMLGGGAVAGHLAILLLSFAAAWGIAVPLNAGWAFLIVGGIWALIAGVLALRGRVELRRLNMKPQQTVETIQEDVQWAKNQRK